MKFHFDSNRFNIPETDREVLEELLFSWPILFLNLFVWSFLVSIISFYFHHSIFISIAIFLLTFTLGFYLFKTFIKWLER